MLINPTSIDVDHKGRVWVAEAVNYRRKMLRPADHPQGGRPHRRAGRREGRRARRRRPSRFYQGPEIYGPIGICVAPYPDGKGQKVFVCQSPDILVFEDKDGDLQGRRPAEEVPHRLSAASTTTTASTASTSARTASSTSPSATQGVDGPAIERRQGPQVDESNNTDCRAGTVWRCDMDGTNLELIAHNFRNNYECCVDSFGEIWLSDNDDDGNQQTRICFVMPGGNYGYHPRGPGQTPLARGAAGHRPQDAAHRLRQPDRHHASTRARCCRRSTAAQLLHCDAGPREVRCVLPQAEGGRATSSRRKCCSPARDNWFRPSDVCVAPDGSIFVADWYDRGVGGHGMGDPTDGRIYRITPKGHKGYKVPEVKLETKEGVLAALGFAEHSARAAAIAAIRKSLATVSADDAL